MSAKQKRRVGGVEYEGSTPLDETLKIALDADKEITQLKALNAELLEALEALKESVERNGMQDKLDCMAYANACILIRKARN